MNDEIRCAIQAIKEAEELNIPGTLAQRRMWIAGRKLALMAERAAGKAKEKVCELTLKQIDTLKFICEVGLNEWRTPLRKELAEHFGVTESTIVHRLEGLRAKGYLRIDTHQIAATEKGIDWYWNEWS